MPHKVLLLVIGLGALRGSACGDQTPGNGPNGPCTRTSDCADGLICPPQGFCVARDAAASLAMHGDAGGLDANDRD